MKKIVYFILTLFILTSCSKTGDNVKENKKMQTEEKVMNFQEITGQEVESKLKDENFVIVDVRTPGEYNSGHVEGALNIVLDDILKDPNVLKKYENKKIIVYCRSGNRSKTAARKLIQSGYKEVYNAPGVTDYKYNLVK